jgi:hypothetical protein
VASCRTAAGLQRCLAETISAMLVDCIPEAEANAVVQEVSRALDERERKRRRPKGE